MASTELTEEQRQRIEANRRRALELQKKCRVEHLAASPAASPAASSKSGGSSQDRKRSAESFSTRAGGSGAAAVRSTNIPNKRQHGPEDGGPASAGASENAFPTGAAAAAGQNSDVCEVCGDPNAPIDVRLWDAFTVAVCARCRTDNDEYGLVPKKDVAGVYLLPEGTISVLPFLVKDNPRHGSWNKMKLYLRKEVEKYSDERWGGPEGLDAERRRREHAAYERSVKKTKRIFKKFGKEGHAAASGGGDSGFLSTKDDDSDCD
ncbi:unnamed protein product [Phaeothamnion confervicola]